MRITVSVDEVDQLSVPDIKQMLAAYLFETRVKVIKENISLSVVRVSGTKQKTPTNGSELSDE